ncbi:hypothetical protein [Cellulomonas soli]
MTTPEPDATAPDQATVPTPARGVPLAPAAAAAPADADTAHDAHDGNVPTPAPAPQEAAAPPAPPAPPAPRHPRPPGPRAGSSAGRRADPYGPVPPQGYGPVPPQGYGPVPPGGQPPLAPGAPAPAAPSLRFLAMPAAAAGIGYAATLLVAVVASIALVASMSGTESLPTSALASLPFILTGAALLGPLHAGGSAGGYDAFSVQVALTPLTLTLVALVAIAAWTRLRGDADRTAKERWRDAVVTGGVLGLGAGILVALVRLTWSVDMLFVSADVTVGAGPVGTIFGGFVVGTLGSALGSALTRRGPDSRRLGFALPAGSAPRWATCLRRPPSPPCSSHSSVRSSASSSSVSRPRSRSC